jgi:hypothetical protein
MMFHLLVLEHSLRTGSAAIALAEFIFTGEGYASQ